MTFVVVTGHVITINMCVLFLLFTDIMFVVVMTFVVITGHVLTINMYVCGITIHAPGVEYVSSDAHVSLVCVHFLIFTFIMFVIFIIINTCVHGIIICVHVFLGFVPVFLHVCLLFLNFTIIMFVSCQLLLPVFLHLFSCLSFALPLLSLVLFLLGLVSHVGVLMHFGSVCVACSVVSWDLNPLFCLSVRLVRGVELRGG